jgi:hypothetical protein
MVSELSSRRCFPRSSRIPCLLAADKPRWAPFFSTVTRTGSEVPLVTEWEGATLSRLPDPREHVHDCAEAKHCLDACCRAR